MDNFCNRWLQVQSRITNIILLKFQTHPSSEAIPDSSRYMYFTERGKKRERERKRENFLETQAVNELQQSQRQTPGLQEAFTGQPNKAPRSREHLSRKGNLEDFDDGANAGTI